MIGYDDKSDPDGFGAGFAAIPVMVLGLPWSVPLFANPFDPESNFGIASFVIPPAWLNLVWHYLRRRRKWLGKSPTWGPRLRRAGASWLG